MPKNPYFFITSCLDNSAALIAIISAPSFGDWLPAHLGMPYRILIYAFVSIHNLTPLYLSDRLLVSGPARSLFLLPPTFVSSAPWGVAASAALIPGSHSPDLHNTESLEII